jgi:hypothetical protein
MRFDTINNATVTSNPMVCVYGWRGQGNLLLHPALVAGGTPALPERGAGRFESSYRTDEILNG